MIEQKLDYIHHNPVKGKWNLVDDFTNYQHSSTGFYELGSTSPVDILHYKDLNKDCTNNLVRQNLRVSETGDSEGVSN